MTTLAPPEKPGWPRERLPWTTDVLDADGNYEEVTRMLPNVYLGGVVQRDNDWDAYDAKHSERCEALACCAVCGLGLEGLMLFGYARDFYTNGPPVHPRCMALSLKFCPHFSERMSPHRMENGTVAYGYYGRRPLQCTRPQQRNFFGIPLEGEFREPTLLGSYTLNEDMVEPFTRAEVIEAARELPLGVIPPWA